MHVLAQAHSLMTDTVSSFNERFSQFKYMHFIELTAFSRQRHTVHYIISVAVVEQIHKEWRTGEGCEVG